jgi:predicted DNA-binding transcriptional regulator AlpA
MKLGKFPKCFKIVGGHAVAWNIDEVEAWMTARMAERDAQAAS